MAFIRYIIKLQNSFQGGYNKLLNYNLRPRPTLISDMKKHVSLVGEVKPLSKGNLHYSVVTKSASGDIIVESHDQKQLERMILQRIRDAGDHYIIKYCFDAHGKPFIALIGNFTSKDHIHSLDENNEMISIDTIKVNISSIKGHYRGNIFNKDDVDLTQNFALFGNNYIIMEKDVFDNEFIHKIIPPSSAAIIEKNFAQPVYDVVTNKIDSTILREVLIEVESKVKGSYYITKKPLVPSEASTDFIKQKALEGFEDGSKSSKLSEGPKVSTGSQVSTGSSDISNI